MLHEVLAAYLEKVEQAILQCRNIYHHKHLPDAVIPSNKPDIESVIEEAERVSP